MIKTTIAPARNPTSRALLVGYAAKARPNPYGYDPIMPMAFSETIAACLPPHLLHFETFADAGHGVIADAPERALAVIRKFILAA